MATFWDLRLTLALEVVMRELHACLSLVAAVGGGICVSPFVVSGLCGRRQGVR